MGNPYGISKKTLVVAGVTTAGTAVVLSEPLSQAVTVAFPLVMADQVREWVFGSDQWGLWLVLSGNYWFLTQQTGLSQGNAMILSVLPIAGGWLWTAMNKNKKS